MSKEKIIHEEIGLTMERLGKKDFTLQLEISLRYAYDQGFDRGYQLALDSAVKIAKREG